MARRKASAASRARLRTMSTVTTHLDAKGNRHVTVRDFYMQSRDKTTFTITFEVFSTPKGQVQLRARERCGTVSVCLATRSRRGKVKRGISLKLHEEERERRIEHDPAESEADTDYVTIDPDTMSMLQELGMNCLPNITTQPAQTRDAAGDWKTPECSSTGVHLHSEH